MQDTVISVPEDHFFPEDGDEAPALPATSSGPQVSSDAPSGDGTDSADGTDTVDALPEFDPRHKEAFNGLLFLGALTDSFSWAGHKFIIRTLTIEEYLAVALVHQRYKESIGDVRAYTTAMVAAGVERVDGQPLPIPLDRQAADTAVEFRFQWVIEHWYPATVDALYERQLGLENKVEEVLKALGNSSG